MRWILSSVCSLSLLLMTGCLNLEGHSPASTSTATTTAAPEETTSPSTKTEVVSPAIPAPTPIVKEAEVPYTGPPPLLPSFDFGWGREVERMKGCRDAVFYTVNKKMNQAIVFYAKPGALKKLFAEHRKLIQIKNYPDFQIYLDVYEKPFKSVDEFPYCLPQGSPQVSYHTRWTASPDAWMGLGTGAYYYLSPAAARLELYSPYCDFFVEKFVHIPSKIERTGEVIGSGWIEKMQVILGWEPTEEVRSEADLSKLLVPQFKFTKDQPDGCSNLIYILGDGWDEAVLFKYDRDKLDLMTGPKTFSLENPPESLEISLDLYLFRDPSNTGVIYCTDVDSDAPTANLKATSGSVEMLWERVAESADDNRPDGYQYLTIRLKNAVFASPDGKKVVPLKALNVIRAPMYSYFAPKLPETRIEVPVE